VGRVFEPCCHCFHRKEEAPPQRRRLKTDEIEPECDTKRAQAMCFKEHEAIKSATRKGNKEGSMMGSMLESEGRVRNIAQGKGGVGE